MLTYNFEYHRLEMRIASLVNDTLPEFASFLRELRVYHERKGVDHLILLISEEKREAVERYYHANDISLATVSHLSLPLGYARNRDLPFSCSSPDAFPSLLERLESESLERGRGYHIFVGCSTHDYKRLPKEGFIQI